MRIKAKDIPTLRDKLAVEQNNKCWICKIDLRCVTPALDHDHKTGLIRGVLCINCNAMEGKIFNTCRRGKRQRTEADFLKSILEYWDYFRTNNRELLHPSHRTKEEKRVSRNKKAKLRRLKKDS